MIRMTMTALLLATSGTALANDTQQANPQLVVNDVASVPTAPAPLPPPPAPVMKQVTLPANSEVLLRMAEELSTKGGGVKEGQMFRLTVAYDVKKDGVTVIPMGTPATGEVTWKTGRAVFGKSGKMEIALRSINLDGERIEVSGDYRQEGEGDTLAAVGAVVLAAPLLVVTGKSAIIPRGRELMAHTVSPVTMNVRQTP